MNIFQAEIKDGISEQIKNNTSLAYCSAVTKSKNIDKISTAKLFEKSKASIDDYDLYYIDSILVSTGINLNEDCFDPIITWGARNTPIDKQLNYMHNESCILGHSTGSLVIDRAGKIIPDDSAIDDIPNNFDIVVSSVLYRAWSKDENKELMETIIGKIEAGTCFISMECLFKDFDYAMIDKDGNQKVIARNKDTAFLTKYLRAYEGPGVYKDQTIGRLLKNFVFSGKGLVDKPANPRSIIFNETKPFNHKSVAYSYFKEETTNMAKEENKEVDELKSTVAKLETDLATAKKELEVSKANETKLKAEADLACADHGKASKELETVTASLSSVQKELDETKAALDKTTTELSVAKAEKINTDRVSKLVSAQIEKEEADKIVAKWTNLNDEQFNEIVELHAAKKKLPPWLDKEKKDKDDEDADAAEAEAAKALAATESESKTVPVVSETKPETQKSVASWLRNSVLQSTKNAKTEEN